MRLTIWRFSPFHNSINGCLERCLWVVFVCVCVRLCACVCVVVTWKWKTPAYPSEKLCSWGTTRYSSFSYSVRQAMAASSQQSPGERTFSSDSIGPLSYDSTRTPHLRLDLGTLTLPY